MQQQRLQRFMMELQRLQRFNDGVAVLQRFHYALRTLVEDPNKHIYSLKSSGYRGFMMQLQRL